MNSSKLFEMLDPARNVPLGLRLIVGISGFTDAGGSYSLLGENIFTNLDTELVVRFSNDELLDYRSRRPVVYFERDHVSDYQPAVLGIYLTKDEAGQQFLFMHGYEPDFKWEAFADAVEHLVDAFAISEVMWLQSIPFPIPHTRSLGVTVSGTRRDLTDRYSEWKPETQVPGNVLHLLEYRLRALEIPCAGFVLLVPHYLADSEYPQVGITAFELISAATNLVFPTDSLREQNIKFLANLSKQMGENQELARMVESLEQGYKSERFGPIKTPITQAEQPIPTADDLASDIEDYLAARRKNNAEDQEN
ncbi:MAG: hypothetical protein RIS80_807 [Actinomycetota bacterium]|jgi:PAC2 family